MADVITIIEQSTVVEALASDQVVVSTPLVETAVEVSNLRGPQGAIGPRGFQGAQGEQGVPGQDAELPADLTDPPDLVLLFENGLT